MARTALVVYGSETGNAQDVADEVGRLIERQRFTTTVSDLDSIELRSMVKATFVVFVVATTGQGEMPQNARAFWQLLLSSSLKPGLLHKVRFTSFGLGDSSYARYNVSHRMLCNRMIQLGAQLFCEKGEGNEQHPEGHSAGLREWIVQLKQAVSDRYPLPDGVQPVAEQDFLEPKFKLALSISHAVSAAASTVSEVPSSSLLPVFDAHVGQVVANERVTPSTHFQDVRLLDIHLDQGLAYGPGAIATVFPKNFPSDVQAFIDLMSWQDVADRSIHLESRADIDASQQNQSPLKHLDLSAIELTLRWLLENVLDIMSIPRRSFFASLLHFAKTETEDERYQKDRLIELANPELIDELWDYTTRPKRTIVEVMSDFTTVQIPWQYALSTLPAMRGRQFSIASGGQLAQSVLGKTRIQLLVAIADPPSPIIKYKRRYGVCTRYITTILAGQRLSIGLHPGYLNVSEEEIHTPALMIGPGTGLAPMRSMIYERLEWSKNLPDRQGEAALQGDTLVFGCRNEDADHFFRDEWDRLSQESGLQVLTAFSRDKNKPRQYVQDVLRAHGSSIHDLIYRKGGKIFVCGSSGNMPKGVRQALLDISVEHGGMSSEEAESRFDDIEKQGRYKQETW